MPDPSPMRESQLHRLIYQRSQGLSARVLVGPGDDAAVVSAGADGRVLLTVDQVIQGRHWAGALTAGAAIDGVARKAIARSVSDIGAMAGTPVWSLATGALPRGFPQALADELFERMAHWARHFGCPIVGGDIATLPGSEDPVVLTVTVGGDPHATRGAVLRSGARAGDLVYVTGRIGGSLKSGRHLSFEPRVREGAWLAGTLGQSLHAMIDLSDGLGRDAARVGEASEVRVRIEEARVPRHADAGPGALSDGEDYELLFVAGADARIPAACPETGTPITLIGRVDAGAGCVIVDAAGRERDAAEMGWDH